MEQELYIDLNRKLQNLETKLIKSQVPSSVFLTSIAICILLILISFMRR